MNAKAAFPWSDAELKRRVQGAVQKMWRVREEQASKQLAAGKSDAGDRGKVTGGRHLDGFCELLGEIVGEAGFTGQEVRFRSGVEVPGFYRPVKKWDLVVIRRDRLCAAVELKSMAGAYGKNLNNRTEEALGSATDIWAAYKQGTLGVTQPWLGYLFVIREEPRSTVPVAVARTPLKTDPVFAGTSYLQRYGIMCERMVLDRLYTSASYLSAPLEGDGQYEEPREGLGFAQFVRSLFGHLVGCA